MARSLLDYGIGPVQNPYAGFSGPALPALNQAKFQRGGSYLGGGSYLDNIFLEQKRQQDEAEIAAIQQQAQQQAATTVNQEETAFEWVTNSIQKPLDAVKNAAEAVGQLLSGEPELAGKAALRTLISVTPFSETALDILLPEQAEADLSGWLKAGQFGGVAGGNPYGGSGYQPTSNLLDSAFGDREFDPLDVAGAAGELLLDPLNWFFGAGAANKALKAGETVASGISRAAAVKVARELPLVAELAAKSGKNAVDLVGNPTLLRTAAGLAGENVDEVERTVLGYLDKASADLRVMRPQEMTAAFDDLLGVDNPLSITAREARDLNPASASLIPGGSFAEQLQLGQRTLYSGPYGELYKRLPWAAKFEEGVLGGMTSANRAFGAGSALFRPTSRSLALIRGTEEVDKEAVANGMLLMGNMQNLGERLKNEHTFTGWLKRLAGDGMTAFRRGFIQDADTAAVAQLRLMAPTIRRQVGTAMDAYFKPIVTTAEQIIEKAKASGAYDEGVFFKRVRDAVEGKTADTLNDSLSGLVNEYARNAEAGAQILERIQNLNRAALETLDEDGVGYFGRIFSDELMQILHEHPELKSKLNAYRDQVRGVGATAARADATQTFDEAESGLRKALGLEGTDIPLFERDATKSLRKQGRNAEARIFKARMADELVRLSSISGDDLGKGAEDVVAAIYNDLDAVVKRGASAVKESLPDGRVVMNREVVEGLERAGSDEAGLPGTEWPVVKTQAVPRDGARIEAVEYPPEPTIPDVPAGYNFKKGSNGHKKWLRENDPAWVAWLADWKKAHEAASAPTRAADTAEDLARQARRQAEWKALGVASFDGNDGKAAIEALAAMAERRGATVRHKSNSGSIYITLPDGTEVRLSDHAVPLTGERLFAAENGGKTWAGGGGEQIVIGYRGETMVGWESAKRQLDAMLPARGPTPPKRTPLSETDAQAAIARWESLAPRTRALVNRTLPKTPASAIEGDDFAEVQADLEAAQEAVKRMRPAGDAAPSTAFPAAPKPESVKSAGASPEDALAALERLGRTLEARGAVDDLEAVQEAVARVRAAGGDKATIEGALNDGLKAAENIRETKQVVASVNAKLEDAAIQDLVKAGYADLADAQKDAAVIRNLGKDAVDGLRQPKEKTPKVQATESATEVQRQAEAFFKAETDKYKAATDAVNAARTAIAEKGAKAAKDGVGNVVKAEAERTKAELALGQAVGRFLKANAGKFSLDEVLAVLPNDAKAAWVKSYVANTPLGQKIANTPGIVSGLEVMASGSGAMLPNDLESLTRLATTMVPESVLADWHRVQEVAARPNAFLRALDKVNHVWRSWILALPPSMVNDITGNAYTAVAIGGVSPTDYVDAVRGYMGHAANDPSNKFGGVLKKAGGKVDDAVLQTAEGAMKESELVAAFSRMGGDAIEHATAQRPVDMLTAALKPGGAGNAVADTVKAPFKWVADKGFTVRELNDASARYAVFRHNVLQGKSLEDAMHAARGVIFDFSDVTKMESNVMRRLFLFYTFTRKAAPLALRSALENPIRFKMLMLMSGGGMQSDNEDLPTYARRLPGLYIGKGEDGSPRFLSLTGSITDSVASLTEDDTLSGLMENVMQGSNPLLRTAIEAGTDRDFFTGNLIGLRDENRAKALSEPTADRAPAWMQLLPEGLKDAVGYRAEVDGDGNVTSYVMDSRTRWLLQNALPFGSAMRFGDVLTPGLDKTKGAVDQVLPLAGARIRTVRGGKESEADARKLRDLRDKVALSLDKLPGSPVKVNADFTWSPNRDTEAGRELGVLMDRLIPVARSMVTDELNRRGLRGAERAAVRQELLGSLRTNLLNTRFPGVAAQVKLLEQAGLAHQKVAEPEQFERKYQARQRKQAAAFDTADEQMVTELFGIE